MASDPQGPRFELAKLVLTVISTLVVVAGFALALVAGNRISISVPKETSSAAETVPPRTATERITETVTVAPPPTVPASGPCNREPNEERIEATPVVLGTCRAAIETTNDQDWYLFQSPQGGPVEVVVERAQTRESGEVISAVLYEDDDRIASELIAAEEPFSFSYTLGQGTELAIVIQDGCSPACELTDYVLKLG